MKTAKFKFKKDSYTRSRGTPAMLKITCAQCGAYVMSYQKDGLGPLKRCYLDRIHHPEYLEKCQHKIFDKKNFPKLECASCSALIGTPMIYEKENRPAYHMVLGAVATKKMY